MFLKTDHDKARVSNAPDRTEISLKDEKNFVKGKHVEESREIIKQEDRVIVVCKYQI